MILIIKVKSCCKKIKLEKTINRSSGAAKAPGNPFKINSELSPKNIAGLAGLAPNENSIQFFPKNAR